MHTRRTWIILAFVASLASTVAGRAASFPAVVVYGDSLSDNGNLYALAGVPGPPYYGGRFSNGPVAVEQLAVALNAPLIDYAFGGATTGVGNIGDNGTQTKAGYAGLPGMLGELAISQLAPAPPKNSLFVVWGGADDFESAGSVAVAVGNIDKIVTTLEAAGDHNILVPGLPDLGLTPEFYGVAAATAYSEAFDQALQASLPSGATYFDTFGLLDSIVNNYGAYGFTDVKDACFDSTTGTVCANPSQYLFWDDIHPTTAADAILAGRFEAAVTPVAATPEPSSILLLGSGLAGAAGLLRRRRVA